MTGFNSRGRPERETLLDRETANNLDRGIEGFGIYLGAYGAISMNNGGRYGKVAHVNGWGIFLNPYVSSGSDAYFGINYELRDESENPLFIALSQVTGIDPWTKNDEEGIKMLREQVRFASLQRDRNKINEELKGRELAAKLGGSPGIVLVEGYHSKR